MNISDISNHELRQAYIDASNKYWRMVLNTQNITQLHRTGAYTEAKQKLATVTDELKRRQG